MTEPFDLSSQYYDLLYRDKDYAAETAYVMSLLSRFGCRSPASMLELGCGTGAHAEIFAGHGYEVLGVDQNREMLQRARQRFARQDNRKLQCLEGDARSFRADRVFDAVVSLFHVASYQSTDDDLASFFQTAATHLSPGGVFIFDVWYGPAVLTQVPTVRVKRVEDEQAEIFRVAEPTLIERSNRVDVEYQIFVTQRNSGAIHRFSERHEMRYYFEPEIQRFASDAGMKIVHQEEWMTSREPSIDSWGVVFVAEKSQPGNHA